MRWEFFAGILMGSIVSSVLTNLAIRGSILATIALAVLGVILVIFMTCEFLKDDKKHCNLNS